MTDGMHDMERDWIDYSYRDKIPKTEFTKAHLEIFRKHAECWKLHAYSTQPIDKPKATSAINSIYALENRDAPKIVWMKSPLATVFAKVLCDEMLGLHEADRVYNCDRTGKNVWWHVGHNISASVDDEMTDFVVINSEELEDIRKNDGFWGSRYGRGDTPGLLACQETIKGGNSDAVRHLVNFHKFPAQNPKVEKTVCDSIGLSIYDSFGIHLSEIANTSFLEETRQHLVKLLSGHDESYENRHFPKSENESYIERELLSACRNRTYSQYDLAELSRYKCLADANLVSKSPLMEALYLLCLSTGWVLPSRRVCFVSERPEILKTDDRGLPHCEDGPAIKYSDGYSLHAWHGVRFPKDWVENLPRPADALKWPNIEQRRIACEMIGWDRILDELNAVVINCDDDPAIGELVSVELPDIGKERFLRVRCGTGRNFALPVPPEMKTAHQANAWTWGLSPEQYQPEVRT